MVGARVFQVDQDGTREAPAGIREVPDGIREAPDGIREVPAGIREDLGGTKEDPVGAKEAREALEVDGQMEEAMLSRTAMLML